MKETEVKVQERIEVQALVSQESLKHVGHIKVHRGHRLFSLNLATKEVQEETPELSIDFETKKVLRKVKIKDGFMYATALNKKNAFKYFNRRAKAILENTK